MEGATLVQSARIDQAWINEQLFSSRTVERQCSRKTHSVRVSLWVVTPVNGYVDIFTLHDGSAALRICGSSAARSLKSGCEGHEMQRMRQDGTTCRLMNT